MRAILQWAMTIIAKYCLAQDNCNNCPFKDKCSKMPCEWL